MGCVMKGIKGSYYYLKNMEKPTIQCTSYTKKFPDDTISFSNEEYSVFFEGCLLNKTSIMKNNNGHEFGEILIKMWKKHKEKVILLLHGMYVFVIYDKKHHSFFLSNDLISKRPLYYFFDHELLVFSSSYRDLIQTLKRLHKSLTLSKLAVANMLIDGMLAGDCTYANEVKYISRYRYLMIENGEISIQKIESHEFSTSTYQWSFI